MAERWLVAVGLCVLGLVFGSFAATVALRFPQGRSALTGRSACDGCGRTLGAGQLVPVLSFLLQRGRCRWCDAWIAPVHLAGELAGGAIGLAAGLVAPDWIGVGGAVFGWQLLLLAAIDGVALRLPHRLSAALGATGLLATAVDPAPALPDRLIGGLTGFGALWVIAAAYRRLRGRDGLGGGDPWLLGAIGLWLGWRALPEVVLGGCLIGLGAVLVLRLRGRAPAMDARLPFGTCLAPAAFALWLIAHRAV